MSELESTTLHVIPIKKRVEGTRENGFLRNSRERKRDDGQE